jgi:hypothetical protein
LKRILNVCGVRTCACFFMFCDGCESHSTTIKRNIYATDARYAAGDGEFFSSLHHVCPFKQSHILGLGHCVHGQNLESLQQDQGHQDDARRYALPVLPSGSARSACRISAASVSGSIVGIGEPLTGWPDALPRIYYSSNGSTQYE